MNFGNHRESSAERGSRSISSTLKKAAIVGSMLCVGWFVGPLHAQNAKPQKEFSFSFALGNSRLNQQYGQNNANMNGFQQLIQDLASSGAKIDSIVITANSSSADQMGDVKEAERRIDAIREYVEPVIRNSSLRSAVTVNANVLPHSGMFLHPEGVFDVLRKATVAVYVNNGTSGASTGGARNTSGVSSEEQQYLSPFSGNRETAPARTTPAAAASNTQPRVQAQRQQAAKTTASDLSTSDWLATAENAAYNRGSGSGIGNGDLMAALSAANTAAVSANTAAVSANTASVAANTATVAANTATVAANTATLAANKAEAMAVATKQPVMQPTTIVNSPTTIITSPGVVTTADGRPIVTTTQQGSEGTTTTITIMTTPTRVTGVATQPVITTGPKTTVPVAPIVPIVTTRPTEKQPVGPAIGVAGATAVGTGVIEGDQELQEYINSLIADLAQKDTKVETPVVGVVAPKETTPITTVRPIESVVPEKEPVVITDPSYLTGPEKDIVKGKTVTETDAGRQVIRFDIETETGPTKPGKAPKVKATKAPKVKAAKTPKVKATSPKAVAAVKAPKAPRSGVEAFEPKLSVKTNLAYWAAVVANLEAEYHFADRWSVAVEGMYTDWDMNLYQKNYAVNSISGEGRYWFNNKYPGQYRGLYVGVYGHGGEFDYKFGEEKRGYTGAYWGAGVSVGAYFPFTKKFGLELGLRGGYISADYDSYTHEAYQGTYYDLYRKSAKTNYFGLTGAKVSLVYRFGW